MGCVLRDWGARLWRDGYFSKQGLRLILEPPRSSPPGKEVNPENLGYLFYPYTGWTLIMGPTITPYDVNFLLEDGLYNFTPEPPPQD